MKYQGNKSRFVKYLLPFLLKDRKEDQWYVEPFCGSCSVLQNVEGKRIASDKNKYLISMWKELIHNPDYFPTNIPRELYADVRTSFNKKDGRYEDCLIGWVGYMGSFNGRFFDGGYSGHNVIVKNGKSRDYISENINNTKQQIPFLQNVVWKTSDFDEIEIPEKSIIYCDIPYKNTKQYLFSRDFDYEKFYKWCFEMKELGHTVYISEYQMPNEFECIWQKETICAMNQINTKVAVEKLFIPK